MHDSSLFLTLTYDDAHVPLTLCPADLSGFLKRLRGRLGSFRFFGCGEYGDRFGRPHYHCLLFGAEVDRAERVGVRAYRSQVITETWDQGAHYVGTCTPASVAYVAGYCAKKWGTALKVPEYLDPETGAVEPHVRPFSVMSRRPGIGVPYLEKYGMELLRGYAVREGKKIPLPRYYREWLAAREPARMARLKRDQARFGESDFAFAESSNERLQTRQQYAELSRAFFHPE